MPSYGNEPETDGRRRDVMLAGFVMILALSTQYLSEPSQQGVSTFLQTTVLRPFIGTQERLTEARLRAGEVDVLTVKLDSLSAILATTSELLDENRTLRTLLGLSERAGQGYVPATVLRPGTPGSESMFLVDVGREDGVRRGAPVVNADGLVGVIREVHSGSSVGMDWSHPDFRASAMLIDGTTYGLVENRRGRFREEDRLVLNGIAYNQRVVTGLTVLTSGLGDLLPRGIPVGRVAGLADAEGSWRKSYFLQPMVQTGAATHVLILVGQVGGDVSSEWPGDTLVPGDEGGAGEPHP